MGDLIKEIDYNINLTLVSVRGMVTFEEIIAVIEEYYCGKPTRFLMFDFQDADTSTLTSEQLRNIAHASKRNMHSRPGAKTAIVVKSDAEYGMGRMFETFIELEELPIAFNIFKDIESAMRWILTEDG